MQKTLLAVLALLLCPGSASAQEQHRTFKVPFHSVADMILIEVKVSGKPATFLLDTGANVSLALHTHRDTLNIELDPAFPDCVTVVQVKELDRLGVTRNQELTRSLGNIDGILGENFLRGFRAFRVDYKAHVIEFEQ